VQKREAKVVHHGRGDLESSPDRKLAK
jgi:hypothetical protein